MGLGFSVPLLPRIDISDVALRELYREEAALLERIHLAKRTCRLLKRRRIRQYRLLVIYTTGRLRHSRFAPQRRRSIQAKCDELRDILLLCQRTLDSARVELAQCRRSIHQWA